MRWALSTKIGSLLLPLPRNISATPTGEPSSWPSVPWSESGKRKCPHLVRGTGADQLQSWAETPPRPLPPGLIRMLGRGRAWQVPAEAEVLGQMDREFNINMENIIEETRGDIITMKLQDSIKRERSRNTLS